MIFIHLCKLIIKYNIMKETGKGWKTVGLGVLLALISILSNDEMKVFIGDNIPAIGGSIGVLLIILRAFTNSGIFKKD